MAHRTGTIGLLSRIIILLLLVVMAGALVRATLRLPSEPRGLTRLASEQLAASGVEHPVTAVLLNFRSYDTWLELAVLLLSMMGVLALQRQNHLAALVPPPMNDPVQRWLVRWLGPVMVLLAGYLLWLGKFAPGGAFQAGVVLSAAGVLLWLSGNRSVAAIPGGWWRAVLLLGYGAFLLVAIFTAASGRELLEYPRPWAGPLILLIETFAAISIGAVLAGLFVGLQPRHVPSHS